LEETEIGRELSKIMNIKIHQVKIESIN